MSDEEGRYREESDATQPPKVVHFSDAYGGDGRGYDRESGNPNYTQSKPKYSLHYVEGKSTMMKTETSLHHHHNHHEKIKGSCSWTVCFWLLAFAILVAVLGMVGYIVMLENGEHFNHDYDDDDGDHSDGVMCKALKNRYFYDPDINEDEVVEEDLEELDENMAFLSDRYNINGFVTLNEVENLELTDDSSVVSLIPPSQGCFVTHPGVVGPSITSGNIQTSSLLINLFESVASDPSYPHLNLTDAPKAFALSSIPLNYASSKSNYVYVYEQVDFRYCGSGLTTISTCPVVATLTFSTLRKVGCGEEGKPPLLITGDYSLSYGDC